MSSKTVRDEFRAAWPVLVPGIPLYETINVALDPQAPNLPDLWATLIFNTSGSTPVTMGTNPWMEETGVVSVMLLSLFNTGDDASAQAATSVVEAWTGWQSADGSVWVNTPGAPRAPEEATLGRWSILVVDLDYRYQRRG